MSNTQRYAPLDTLKASWQARQATPTEIICTALSDKGYRRGQTYTPRGSLHTVAAFTTYTKRFQFLVLMEYADGGCDVLRPLSEANDIQQTIAAIP
jgi:hypothetical protein